MRVLVTGAAGFIGSHFCEAILRSTDWDLVALDRLDETSTLARIGDTDAYQADRARAAPRFRFVWHDLRAPINDMVAQQLGEIHVVIHLAASTHVDRSIADPASFVADNVVGTLHVLEFVRGLTDGRWRTTYVNPRLVYFSTDEVFGPATTVSGDGAAGFREWDRYKSSNPYAATKAAGEELVLAYVNTYDVDAIITHMVNAFGERQHHEKYIPMLVRRLLLGLPIQVHADPTRTRPASRFWIHARNAFEAVHFLLRDELDSAPGEKFNIGTTDEVDCLRMAEIVSVAIDRPLRAELVDAVAGRPGHDLRYSLDCGKLAAMGWSPPIPFEESLVRCVRWMAANPRWLGLP